MDPDRDLSRAAHARTLLSDELMAEAFGTLEREYIEAWRNSPARDAQAREALWQAVQIVGKVRAHLQSVADTGKLTQRQIDEYRASQPGWAQRFLRSA